MKDEMVLDKRSPLSKIMPEFNICLYSYTFSSVEASSTALANLARHIYTEVNGKFSCNEINELFDSAAQLKQGRLTEFRSQLSAGEVEEFERQLNPGNLSRFKQLVLDKYLAVQKENASKKVEGKEDLKLVPSASRYTSSVASLSSTVLSGNCRFPVKACLTAIVVVAVALFAQYLRSANQEAGNLIDR